MQAPFLTDRRTIHGWVIITLAAALACGCTNSKPPATEMSGFRPLLTATGRTAAEARGHWRTRGYGYRLAFLEQDIEMYCETQSFVYRLPTDARAFFAEALFKPGDTEDTLLVTNHPSEAPRVARAL